MLKAIGRLVYRLFKVEMRYRGNWKQDNKWLLDKHFATILDIGANTGQFARKMRTFFPEAKIISFEPIPSVYEQLKKNFSGDTRFEAYCCGLGEKEETATFFLNESTASSSLLKMQDHTLHFAAATVAEPIEVVIRRLDDVLANHPLPRPILVKIDVQGFEDKVITGGTDVLKQADMVISEVSYVPLYEGQKLFNDIYDQIKALGFLYHGNYEQLHSPANNMPLQGDAIFMKKSS